MVRGVCLCLFLDIDKREDRISGKPFVKLLA